ncbi:uncharacterized protein SPAPADRAFT_135961 [Spathaspora passalidarum NRRL Y-27907]|uniref:Protein phosphatase methylesterase 1 n=1 Tax=Spathaspora passalidarum (strain NRRL Y-27907 / 11-Y1) TaxID=619300 RepID=G3AMR9_SPAPN|nr:uncharacterized protein SPAPADRAFT_135961 [Spathaspora passalidarum NRRL Y-27907]EGW33513.1 hypothetical protein SPAPADRAFT_135961 [Spathaspora passalidarum NRRL Y-27907]
MSDLHKSFLKRIKKKELEFGLTSLSEDSNDQPESIDQNIPEVNVSADEGNILARFKSFKETYFTESEVYQDKERNLSFQTYYRAPSSDNTTVIFCAHGAGSSSMTFATLAKQITQEESFGIFTYDFRGHGASSPSTEYSLPSLVEDARFVITTFLKLHPGNTLYLLGHSLGGAVLSKLVNVSQPESVHGLILLDIVEETAVKSLTVMPQFIERLPKRFPSLVHAIDWHMKFLLHNKESAELSVPDLLHLDKLTWKADLSLTTPYWDTWFDGLSDNFINFSGPKLLLLSAHETLDKKLMIGQMQGKYQLVVFNNNQNSGHFIHEDLPNQTSICVSDFIKRSTNPQKFLKQEGVVPKWGGKIHQ